MEISGTELVYFSPTGTTRRVLNGIAKGLGYERVGMLDVTMTQSREWGEGVGDADNVVVIGAPVYAGRVAATAAERIKQLEGKGRAAVVVVVYGNRDYDDALLELSDLAKAAGFVVVAGGAFIGEHSFSTDECELAVGRPDEVDANAAVSFGEQVRGKLDGLSGLGDVEGVGLPGNAEYKDGMSVNDMGPSTDEGKCGMCGICVEVCPVDAISMEGFELKTDMQKCILCGACVRECRVGARALDDERIEGIRQRLKAGCEVRREPEVFV
ncbi:4Fe-4S binding protein [Planctomycetota bacterium]|nr:4Fe-4S binding protein [Planctomycetota bacterium]